MFFYEAYKPVQWKFVLQDEIILFSANGTGLVVKKRIGLIIVCELLVLELVSGVFGNVFS